MSTTALALISRAFKLLNIYQPGETIPANDAQDALDLLNGLIGIWKLDALMAPVSLREVFPLVAGRGGPATPYTIGDGGDFDTSRPPSPQVITGAGLLLNASVPPVEIARAVYTDDQWNGIAIKDLSNALFTGIYYNATTVNGRGTLCLWPVPDTSLNSLVLYRQQPLAAFVSLSAAYDLPEGYDLALTYNLARLLADPFGKTLSANALDLATSALARVRASNVDLADLACDPMFLGGSPRTGYNIQTGT